MQHNTKGGSSTALLTLHHTLQEHQGPIHRIAWSPKGMLLASPSSDTTIRIWNAETGMCLHILRGHNQSVNAVTWSPDGTMLASCSNDETIRIWDTQTGQLLASIETMRYAVNCIGWSPDGTMIATGSGDQLVRLWDVKSKKLIHSFSESYGPIVSLAWSLDGQCLAASSAGDDVIRLWNIPQRKLVGILKGYAYAANSIAWSPDGKTIASDAETFGHINLWNTKTCRRTNVITGHSASVRSVSFSSDGRLLASKSADDTVRIWRLDTREVVEILQEPTLSSIFTSISFHPHAPVLATLGGYDRVIRIWDVNTSALFGQSPTSKTSIPDYRNAKVVLLGDSGVGKTGLGLVLTGEPFKATESTHGRKIWSLATYVHEEERDGKAETREILLWDLAGQPGYRLIHQLHLHDVVVALVIFDSHSETDPFAGVYHWARALQTAESTQEHPMMHIKKILVAARVDRGGRSVSKERIAVLQQELGFDGYIETSAKDNYNISTLVQTIKDAIDWKQLTCFTYDEPFQNLREFLNTQKDAKKYLYLTDELYKAFMVYIYGKNAEPAENLYSRFQACMKHMDEQGLVKLLNFGGLVLLQPEFLDAYASALVNAVRDQPDGMGSIAKEQVLQGNFRIPADERLQHPEQEKLLLIAMIEDLLHNQIALQELGDDQKMYLIFPSQTTVEREDLPDPEGKAVIFSFEGPVLNIYATLAVRLSLSGVFTKKQLWKNAASYLYTKVKGGEYGIFLQDKGGGRGELVVFFDQEITNDEGREHFVNFIRAHIKSRALLEPPVKERRVFTCPECGTPFSDAQVAYRRKKESNWIKCSVCETDVSLQDTPVDVSLVLQMNKSADAEIAKETDNLTEQGTNAAKKYLDNKKQNI